MGALLHNLSAYILGLVEDERMIPEAQVNCCKPSHSVEPRNSERLAENAYHRSTESSFHHSWDILDGDGKLDPPFF